MWKKIKGLFSLLFGKTVLSSRPAGLSNLTFFISVADPMKLHLFQENLRSNGVDFEVRNGTDLFVPKDELESVKAIIEEGKWEY